MPDCQPLPVVVDIVAGVMNFYVRTMKQPSGVRNVKPQDGFGIRRIA